MRSILLITSLLMLVLLTSCISTGTLKIYNRTSYNVYMTVQGTSYIIPAHEEFSVQIETGTETLLTGIRSTHVQLILFGETWMIESTESGHDVYVKNTRVKIRSGETTRIYCDPILAAVRIKNHGTQPITHLTYTRHEPPYETTKEIVLPDSIETGEEYFSPIPPLDPGPLDPPIYYTFQLMRSDGSWISFGNSTTVLHVDQEYIIDVYDQDRKLTRSH
jgi:hypothetical protein